MTLSSLVIISEPRLPQLQDESKQNNNITAACHGFNYALHEMCKSESKPSSILEGDLFGDKSLYKSGQNGVIRVTLNLYDRCP